MRTISITFTEEEVTHTMFLSEFGADGYILTYKADEALLVAKKDVSKISEELLISEGGQTVHSVSVSPVTA